MNHVFLILLAIVGVVMTLIGVHYARREAAQRKCSNENDK
jgi:uncharacterized membrane protein